MTTTETVLAGERNPDVAVKTVVVRGVDPDSTLTANSGLPTTAGDILSMYGVPNSVKELIDYYEEHPGIADAVRGVASLRRALRLPASSLTVVRYETARVALADSQEFFRRILESDLRGNGDPLVTLTRRVQRDISDKKTISQARGLYYLFRTWNAFRTGEVLQKMQVGGGQGNPARIPDPK